MEFRIRQRKLWPITLFSSFFSKYGLPLYLHSDGIFSQNYFGTFVAYSKSGRPKRPVIELVPVEW